MSSNVNCPICDSTSGIIPDPRYTDDTPKSKIEVLFHKHNIELVNNLWCQNCKAVFSKEGNDYVFKGFAELESKF